MGETAIVANNARDKEELAASLAIVSEVLGVPAVAGKRVLLESAEPPYQLIIDYFSVAGALASIYTAAGGPTCPELYKRVRKLVTYRKVQIHFEAPRVGQPTIRYITNDATPERALAAIRTDSERGVPDPKSFRWWIQEGWLTYEEWEERGRPSP
jgi:hypothetical protein